MQSVGCPGCDTVSRLRRRFSAGIAHSRRGHGRARHISRKGLQQAGGLRANRRILELTSQLRLRLKGCKQHELARVCRVCNNRAGQSARIKGRGDALNEGADGIEVRDVREVRLLPRGANFLELLDGRERGAVRGDA